MDEKLDKLEEDMSETSSEIAGTWSSSHEYLLAGIADRANCYRWMHNKCQTIYEKYNFYLTVPSIVVSALAGSATIASSALFPAQYQQLASTCIGLATLATGVLTSINQYMKTAQYAESHRATSLSYGKLHTIVASELSMRRDQRLNALEFIKVIRGEQDRLQDNSPIVLDSVISQFRREFKDKTDLEKPEIAGDLDHVHINSSSKFNKHQDSSLRESLLQSSSQTRFTPRTPHATPTSQSGKTSSHHFPISIRAPVDTDVRTNASVTVSSSVSAPPSPNTFDREYIHRQFSYSKKLSEIGVNDKDKHNLRAMTSLPLMSTLTTLTFSGPP